MQISAVMIALLFSISPAMAEIGILIPEVIDAPITENNITVPENLKLLGRGFHQRGTDESLALACFDGEKCSQVRFVHFHDGSAEWIGKVIILPQSTNVETQKKAEKLQLQEYLAERKNITHPIRSALSSQYTSFALVFIVAPAAIGAAVAGGVTAILPMFLVIAGPALTLNIVSYFSNGVDQAIISGRSNKTYMVSHDQDQWNWSEVARTIGTKKFNSLIANIKSGIKSPTEYDKTLRKKIHKKIRKLIQKGVRFSED